MTISRITEIKASSSKSFDDAIRAGITRANKTLTNVRGAWTKNQEVVVARTGRSPSTAWR